MNRNAPTDAAACFLLQEMTEPARSMLEEELLLDDELFALVTASEDELLDASVRQELEPSRERKLAEYALTRPALGRRLDFAAALASRADRNEPADSDTPN